MFCMAHEQHFLHEKLLVFKHLFVEYSTSVLLVFKYATADKCCAKPNTYFLSVGDIRSQIAAEWLQIAQQSQWRAYRKPALLF